MEKNTEKPSITERDAFILAKAKNFTPSEILILLKREGYAPVSRGRIYQVLELHGIKPIGDLTRRRKQ